MIIVKKSSTEVITEEQLRKENPNVSFPSVITKEALEGSDYEVIVSEGLPPVTKYQRVEKVAYKDKGEIKVSFNVVEELPDQVTLLKDYEQAIDNLLDQKAREHKYNNVYTMISYRGDPNPKFNSEAESMFQWRSAVWTKANELLESYNQNQTIPAPTIQSILDQLPKFKLL